MELDNTKNWKWFAFHTIEQDKTWRYSPKTNVVCEHACIGTRSNEMMTGWGIEVLWFDDGAVEEKVGSFRNDWLQNGFNRRKNEYVYLGTFNEDGYFHGSGRYEASIGWIYTGNYNNGNFEGRGLISWKNGFQYDGEWKVDEPVDRDSSLHPLIKSCVEKQLCANTLETGDYYGQFKYRGYCQTCVTICLQADPIVKCAFVTGNHCVCEESTCKARGEREPPKKKQKKIH